MKIMWVSPWGDGWSMAAKLREAGNKVVYYSPTRNKNGAGYLPQVTDAGWLDFAKRSDLVIVDGNFPSRQTRRSWSPSDQVMDLAQIRKAGIPYVGPLPTTELLENDPRYSRKILGKAGLPFPAEGGELGLHVRATVSRDPDGRTFLVFRHHHLIADGNGPELGNLGDVVLAVPPTCRLLKESVDKLVGFMQRIGYNGYLNLSLRVTEEGVVVNDVFTRFIYPAIFAQFGSLLTGEIEKQLGMSVTLLRLDNHSEDVLGPVDEFQGFFGAEVHREFDGGSARAHGQFVGALVGLDNSLPALQAKVNANLAHYLRPGWGFRENVGDGIAHDLGLLSSWGWLEA